VQEVIIQRNKFIWGKKVDVFNLEHLVRLKTLFDPVWGHFLYFLHHGVKGPGVSSPYSVTCCDHKIKVLNGVAVAERSSHPD